MYRAGRKQPPKKWKITARQCKSGNRHEKRKLSDPEIIKERGSHSVFSPMFLCTAICEREVFCVGGSRPPPPMPPGTIGASRWRFPFSHAVQRLR